MKRERQANFELLRIVLMLLIVMGHVIMYSGKSNQIGTIDYYIANFIRSFTMVAVNAFVLLTGYFGTNRNVKKLLRMDMRVCLYTWGGLILGIIWGDHNFSLTKDIQLLFPVATKQYWFISIYFVLCILSPYLNTFLEYASEKMLKEALLVGFVMFYILATGAFLINAAQIVMDAGYGIVNFVYLYCLGFYIRHYDEKLKGTAIPLLMYILACIGTFVVNVVMSRIMGFYFDAMISYNTVFTLSGSIGLFVCFKNLKIKQNPFVTWLGKHSLSVYLIHMCPPISAFLFQKILRVGQFSGFAFAAIIVMLPPVVYLVSAIVDFIVDLLLTPILNACERVFSRARHKQTLFR